MNNSVLNVVRIAKKYGYKTSIETCIQTSNKMCHIVAYYELRKDKNVVVVRSKKCKTEYAEKILNKYFEDYPFKGGY